MSSSDTAYQANRTEDRLSHSRYTPPLYSHFVLRASYNTYMGSILEENFLPQLGLTRDYSFFN
jgi:hypothetical protein